MAGAEADVIAALNDDLDTPSALGRLESLAHDILAAAGAAHAVAPAQARLRRLAKIFGLRLDAPGVETRVVEGWNKHLERFGPEARGGAQTLPAADEPADWRRG